MAIDNIVSFKYILIYIGILPPINSESIIPVKNLQKPGLLM